MASKPNSGGGGSKSRKEQAPDHVGLLFLKERARRRISSLVEGPSSKKDVTDATVRRRLSASLDGSPKISPYYFELCGHLLKWRDEFFTGDEERGQVSLLSCSGVRDLDRDERNNLPVGTKGGFCLVDAATDTYARRGDIYLYSANLQDLKDWMTALRDAFAKYHSNPLAGLGPVQAATEKPILEGDLLVRDTLDGLLQPTWTTLKVSLYDNRIECRRPFTPVYGDPSPNAKNNATGTMERRRSFSMSLIGGLDGSGNGHSPCKVDRYTVNFYVGDTRVRPHAFLMSDFITSYYFAAKDDKEKLFWMQTMAKTIRNLVAMHEHAFVVRQTMQAGGASTRNIPTVVKFENDNSDDDDDDDDDEEEPEEALDQKRPAQVRRESFWRFYGLGLAPRDELSEPPLHRRQSRAKREEVEEDEIDFSIRIGAQTPVRNSAPVGTSTGTKPGGSQVVVAVSGVETPAKPPPSRSPTTTPSPSQAEKKPAASNPLAQSLAKISNSSASLLDPRNLGSKKTKSAASTSLTVFTGMDSVSTKWIREEFERLFDVAKRCDQNGGKGKVAKLTFGDLAKAWGEGEDLGGLLLRAKRHGLAKYEGDMLFADYDDSVTIEIKLA